jgi:hypothetical protein
MMTGSQFEEHFKRMCHAFGTTKSAEIGQAWFDKFGHCDKQTLERTFEACELGDRFPSWGQFKQNFLNCSPEYNVVAVPEEVINCRWSYRPLAKNLSTDSRQACFDGVLIAQGLHPKKNKLQMVLFNCSECSRDRRKFPNGDPSKLVLDNIDHQWKTPRAKAENQRLEKIRKDSLDDESKQARENYLKIFPASWPDKMVATMIGATANQKKRIAEDFIKTQFGTPDPENEAKRAESIRKAEKVENRNAGVF